MWPGAKAPLVGGIHFSDDFPQDVPLRASGLSMSRSPTHCARPERGTPVAEVCRQLGVSEASFYLSKKKYEIREMRQLRDENARLKRLVAELTLDKARKSLLFSPGGISLVGCHGRITQLRRHRLDYPTGFCRGLYKDGSTVNPLKTVQKMGQCQRRRFSNYKPYGKWGNVISAGS